MIFEVIQEIIQPWLESNVRTLIVLGIALAFYALIQRYNRPPSTLAHLPYVSFFSFLKYGFKDELYDTYAKEKLLPLLKANGGFFTSPTIQGWVVRLADPVAIKQFTLKQGKTHVSKGHVQRSGADWKRHRKIANLAFQRSMPVQLFGDLAKRMLRSMEKTEEDAIDVNDLFRRFTLDAIGSGGFGFDFHAIEDKESKWVEYYESVMQGMASPFYIVFPSFDTKYVHWFSKREQLHDNLSKLMENMDEIIEKKRKLVYENVQGESKEKDLLTLMIESELKSEGESLSNEELRSNLCIFFLAGHDTTANTLAAIIYELAKNKEIQEKARKEAIRILGDGPEDIAPTAEQLKELDYINMIIKETLRRHPPAYLTTDRVVQNDLVLGGVHIPKGSDLCLDIYSLHHNADIWSNPFEFNPERFAPGGEADSQRGIAWAPFSSGGRMCVGMNFSLTEQRVLIPMLLKKYTWSLPNDSPHQHELQKRGIAWGLVTFKDKVKIEFKKRN
ncbi:hypothetical protein G6F16_001452 [Rhizopus arrhizus]|nr:hypothetical protein G6F21_007183 [Rhizopus arrhizus]KAG0819816.1 hypothetical protein G6F20_000448 [Rhizopus arrhizus]KAG0841701.1 hypothetical protein G6F19_001412 [Rhizopus arrhizus]KAG0844826.1 hypothetical protein G6F18_001531 [Rhizopus arrhizus]KAG0860233.1 hypothetical protein G6F17_001202 [Rhizopus arrhizus]